MYVVTLSLDHGDSSQKKTRWSCAVVKDHKACKPSGPHGAGTPADVLLNRYLVVVFYISHHQLTSLPLQFQAKNREFAFFFSRTDMARAIRSSSVAANNHNAVLRNDERSMILTPEY